MTKTDCGLFQQLVTCRNLPGEFILKAQAGAAREEHHPLVGVLVIPLPRRSGLACGDDALQTKIFRLQEHLKDFLGYMGRNWGKEIGHKTPLLGKVSSGQKITLAKKWGGTAQRHRLESLCYQRQRAQRPAPPDFS
jgi:hypothetical protein